MTSGRWLLGAGFIIGGVMHFVATPVYMKIVPPILPEPRLLVQISGAAEILGGVGVLLPQTRRAAAWGLVALLLAVLPANVSMAADHALWPAIPEWLLWARLPLQIPLLIWAWSYTRQDRSDIPGESVKVSSF
jgi:uncharacterized membrane protein